MADIDADVVISLDRKGAEPGGDPGYSKLALQLPQLPGGRTIEFGLPDPDARLKKLKERLPNRLHNFLLAVAVTPIALDDDRAARAFVRLDNFAYAILGDLLEGSGTTPQEFINSVYDFLQPVLARPWSDEAHAPLITLQASKADPLLLLLPIELLPVAAPHATHIQAKAMSITDRWSRYLGFRAVVARTLSQHRFISRDPGGKVPLRLFAYRGKDLPEVAEQVDYLRNNAVVAINTEWPGGASINSDEAPHQLATGLFGAVPASAGQMGITHFCCHYFAAGVTRRGSPVKLPFLDFGDNQAAGDLSVTINDLTGALEQLDEPATDDGRDLVFLNACQSAADSDAEESLLGLLLRRGVSDLVGGLSSLPDQLASRFAREFYVRLLDNAPLGAAMLRARRDLMQVDRNPGGLLYTCYGHPLLRLASSSSDATASATPARAC